MADDDGPLSAAQKGHDIAIGIHRAPNCCRRPPHDLRKMAHLTAIARTARVIVAAHLVVPRLNRAKQAPRLEVDSAGGVVQRATPKHILSRAIALIRRGVARRARGDIRTRAVLEALAVCQVGSIAVHDAIGIVSIDVKVASRLGRGARAVGDGGACRVYYPVSQTE